MIIVTPSQHLSGHGSTPGGGVTIGLAVVDVLVLGSPVVVVVVVLGSPVGVGGSTVELVVEVDEGSVVLVPPHGSVSVVVVVEEVVVFPGPHFIIQNPVEALVFSA